MKFLFACITVCLCVTTAVAQSPRDSIHTDFVLYERRTGFDQHLRNKTLLKNLEVALDSNSEDNYREACWAISQFLLRSDAIEKGFYNLFAKYNTLENSTRRAFLEAMYATYPNKYHQEINSLLIAETQPKLFALQALYLYRINNSNNNIQYLLNQLSTRFNGYASEPVLVELKNYLLNHTTYTLQKTPDLMALFSNQKNTGQKIIYSFQRWNRDYPGIAVIQNADGNFQRDASGNFLMVEQLARAGSNLPYFVTNGNTPQGIYSITGTEVSHNLLIGPTPNIQLLMPFEADTAFWHNPYDSAKDALGNYQNLLPAEWKDYTPIAESFYAGKIGRAEIIAHGTTIDPDYFKGFPFYPLTPTQGCLCAKEIWNIFNGKLMESGQFALASGFLLSPATTGYLVVINIDNQEKAVSKNEISQLLESFEQKNKHH